MKTKRLKTDILIIGGGTAGCYAALTIAENSDAKVLICEKAHIKRSGCLAAGVDALNAYITEGKTPQYYVDYAKKDADGIRRKVVAAIKPLPEYVYTGKSVVNGRGFEALVDSAESFAEFIDEYETTDGSPEFFEKWLRFGTYRKIIFGK